MTRPIDRNLQNGICFASKDRVGRDDSCDLPQEAPPELLSFHGKPSALIVSKA